MALNPPPLPHGPPINPLLRIQEPAIVKRRRGRPASSTNTNRVNTSTRREPSAFKRNTGYTRRGRARGGSSQALSRGSSTQISLRSALRATAQSN